MSNTSTSIPASTQPGDRYNVAKQVAAYVRKARRKRVPSDVEQKAVHCIFDLIVATLTSINSNGAVATRKTARRISPRGAANIWFTDLRSQPPRCLG